MELLKDEQDPWMLKPNQAWKFKDAVISQTDIVELIGAYKLHLESHQTGAFTHRMRCPFHKGKNGSVERTPSMFISQRNGDFYCFGCGSSGTSIDFVSLIEGIPKIKALEKLAKRIGLMDKNGEWDELQLDGLDLSPVFDPSKTIEPFLFEMSAAMRNYIKMFVGTSEFNKELRWMERIAKKADEFLATIGYEDWEYAKELSEKVQKSIKDKIRRKDNK